MLLDVAQRIETKRVILTFANAACAFMFPRASERSESLTEATLIPCTSAERD